MICSGLDSQAIAKTLAVLPDTSSLDGSCFVETARTFEWKFLFGYAISAC